MFSYSDATNRKMGQNSNFYFEPKKINFFSLLDSHMNCRRNGFDIDRVN